MNQAPQQVEIPITVCAACGTGQPINDFHIYRFKCGSTRQTIHVKICNDCLNFAEQNKVIVPNLMFGHTTDKGWRYLKLMRSGGGII